MTGLQVLALLGVFIGVMERNTQCVFSDQRIRDLRPNVHQTHIVLWN